MFKYMFKRIQKMVSSMVKTITIKDDVYKKLLVMKREGESFSDLFERFLKGSSLEILAKLRGSVEFTDKEKMLSDIKIKRSEKRT